MNNTHKQMTTNRNTGGQKVENIPATYKAIQPELDHPIGGIDAEGPASHGGADGVASRQALPRP